MPDPPLNPDIKQTVEEAERLLRSLESVEATPGESATRSPLAPEPSQIPAKEPEPAPEPASSRITDSLPASGSTRLGGALLVGGAVFLLAVLTQLPHGSRQFPPLSFEDKCGSPRSPSGYWWPVLGPPNQELLNKVSSQYCGDAFINNNGYLQVASFDNEAEALSFVSRISAATGTSFRVGERFAP